MSTATLPLEVFSQRNFVADFIQLKLTFIPKKKSTLLEPPFGILRGNVRTSSIWLVGKPVYDFLLLSLALAVEMLQAEICRRERFLKGVGHFDRPLKVEGGVAHQPLLGGRNCNDNRQETDVRHYTYHLKYEGN